jgi:hypothetical protein
MNLEASVYGWCEWDEDDTFPGSWNSSQMANALSSRPIALLPSCPPALVRILALPLAKQHISIVAPTTRPGMVLPTMPQSLLDSTERAKEKMLDVTMDMCGGRGGELGRRLEAWLCANNSNACGSWTMEQSQSNSCSSRLSMYFGFEGRTGRIWISDSSIIVLEYAYWVFGP